MHNVRKTIVLLAVQVVVLVLLAEVAARLIFPDFANDRVFMERAFSRLLNSDVVFEPINDNFSEKFGFMLSPNTEITQTSEEYIYTVRTNSHGFRTKEIEPRRDGEYRIMLLGDSMFWGIGIDEEQMVSSVIETLGQPNLSVYNLSINGYNTVQQLIVAETYAESVDPNHIILGFFIANDILPNAIAFVDNDGNYGASDEAQLRLETQLRQRLGVFYYSTVLRILAIPTLVPRIRYQLATSDEIITPSYDLLRNLDALAKRQGMKFSVVILYPKDAVHGGLIESWSNSRKAGELIHQFCKNNNIDVLDLLNYMNTPEHESAYYFEKDGHPNAEGNRVIGRAMFDDIIAPHLALQPQTEQGVIDKRRDH